MKTSCLLLLLSLFSLRLAAQPQYRKGYIIDATGQRTDCTILDRDGQNNPKVVLYKLADGQSQRADASQLRAFGIENGARFVSAKVLIDRSSSVPDKMTAIRSPLWEDEQLFLRLLVEGHASLYTYAEGDLRRFFYTLPDSPAVQLIYKKYLTDISAVTENNTYWQQIFEKLHCGETSHAYMQSFAYDKNDLIRYFKEYNSCMGANYALYPAGSSREILNIKIRPGASSTTMSVYSPALIRQGADLGSGLSPRLGVEFEYFFPYLRNRLSLLAEPTFQYYQYKSPETVFQYPSVEFPLGLRLQFPLSDKLSIFANGLLNTGLQFNFESVVVLDRGSFTERIWVSSANTSFAYGGGLAHKRYQLEMRYYSDRNILRFYLWNYAMNYQRLSLILGYKIVK